MKKLTLIFASFFLSSCVITVNSESSVVNSSPSTSESSSSLDLNLYVDVISSQLNKDESPYVATIIVRLQGQTLEEEKVLQAMQFVANDFYLDHLTEIGLMPTILTIQLFNPNALLSTTPTYGVVRYDINPRVDTYGIQFKEAFLTL